MGGKWEETHTHPCFPTYFRIRQFLTYLHNPSYFPIRQLLTNPLFLYTNFYDAHTRMGRHCVSCTRILSLCCSTALSTVYICIYCVYCVSCDSCDSCDSASSLSFIAFLVIIVILLFLYPLLHRSVFAVGRVVKCLQSVEVILE